jgi:heptosyltransferase-2
MGYFARHIGKRMKKKILIIGPSWIGDMVMAQALFISLQDDARVTGQSLEIDVLAPAWTRPLLERMPEIRRAIDMPFQHGELNLAGRYRLGHSLRKQRYDQVIVLPNSFKSGLLTLFVRVRLRTGWIGEARSILLNDARKLDKEKLPLMVQRFVALGRSVTEPLPLPLPRPRLKTDPEAVAAALQAFDLSVQMPVVCICPGAEFGDAKQWPTEHFVALCDALISQGKQIWILGSDKDCELARSIRDQLPENIRVHCHDLSGRTSLAEVIDLMSLAVAVVSNDSGLMHIAAALARPIVAFYGSTSPDFTPPLTDNVQLLAIDIECRPCFERSCPLKHKRCLVDLTPQMALAAVAALLVSDDSLPNLSGERRTS